MRDRRVGDAAVGSCWTRCRGPGCTVALPQRDVHGPVVSAGSRTPRCRQGGRRSTPGRRAPATGRRRPPPTAPRRRGDPAPGRRGSACSPACPLRRRGRRDPRSRLPRAPASSSSPASRASSAASAASVRLTTAVLPNNERGDRSGHQDRAGPADDGQGRRPHRPRQLCGEVRRRGHRPRHRGRPGRRADRVHLRRHLRRMPRRRPWLAQPGDAALTGHHVAAA